MKISRVKFKMKKIMCALLLLVTIPCYAFDMEVKTICVEGYVFVVVKQKGKYVEVIDVEQVLEQGTGLGKAPQPMRCKDE